MKGERTTAVVTVNRKEANLSTVSRTALEMTAWCYVWLERTKSGLKVTMEERHPSGLKLEDVFSDELRRFKRLETLEKKTRLVRSAIVGHALSLPVRPAPSAPTTSVLDPETEAEIEKLLAEIESDDWLEEASEIAKTWEERFGVETPECKEKKP